MSGRERETIASLVEGRSIMAGVVAGLGGRVVGTQGDSFLSEFPSSTDAVVAALRIQAALAAPGGVPATGLTYRIAVSLGDVYDVAGDIHGDGVNIAARLQALAEPGGILVSGTVHDLVRDRVDADFVFAGEHVLKNISGRIRAYRLTPKTSPSSRPAAASNPAPGYERPAVEIQRFRVIGGGRAARRACDLVAEELTSMLSSVSGILLIRKDLTNPADDETGAHTVRHHHYRLTGSGSAADGRFKFSAQLVESHTGRIVWSDRSDVDLESVVRMPDAIAREVTTSLQVTLTEGERARLWNSGTRDTRAWEQYQRGREKAREFVKTGHREAARLFRTALAYDPSYLAATVTLGYCLMDNIRHNWSDDVDAIWPPLRALHRRALHLGPSYPDTHGLGAYLLVLERRFDEAIEVMRHAISLSRGDSELMAMLGLIYSYANRLEDATLCFERAVRMNPYAPLWLRHNLAWVYWQSRRLNEALDAFREVLKRNAGSVRSLIALTSVQCQLGWLDEARSTAAEVMRLEPLFSVDQWAGRLPNVDAGWVEEVKESLRKAGLK